MAIDINTLKLAEGATLKLGENRPKDDANFVTKPREVVTAVCTDHTIAASSKGSYSIRLHFVVTEGTDAEGNDVTGRNVVCDKYITEGARHNTFADLRMMGWTLPDVSDPNNMTEADSAALDAALTVLANGEIEKSGLASKPIQFDVKYNESFKANQMGFMKLPAAPRISAADLKSLASKNLLKAIAQSAGGRQKAVANAPKDPKSPPPKAAATPALNRGQMGELPYDEI